MAWRCWMSTYLGWLAGAAMLAANPLPLFAGRQAEARAVRMIEELGGIVLRDDRAGGKPAIAADLNSTKVTDADLKCHGDLSQLRTLELVNTQVTGPGLRYLARLKQFEGLRLSGSHVTDAG